MTRRHLPIVIFVAVLVLTAIVGQSRAQNVKRDTTPIVPVIPTADHSNPDRVFLEHADRLMSRPGLNYQILAGDVKFRRGGMYMYCDSAHFSEATGNFDAFGNVRMEQGDTLFIYADQLAYEDSLKLAVLYADDGKKVRLINRDVTLETPVFNYDMSIDLGYYEYVGGKLYDSLNTLTSLDGEYNPSSKEAIFNGQVHLQSRNRENGDTLEIYTHSLYYNTLTHVALMDDESTVRNSDGIIYTSNGKYNTESTISQLFNRSTVVSLMESSRGTTLTADTIYYDRRLGRGEAFGNMILTDTINKMILEGDYGYFDNMIDSAFVTGHARVINYQPVGDGDFNPDMVDTIYVNDSRTLSSGTIYLHGDTIRAFRRIALRNDTIFTDVPQPAVQPADSAAVSVSAVTETPQPSVGDLPPVAASASPDTVTRPMRIVQVADTVRYVVADPHVKFYRKDMQGLCDSLTFVSKDSMLYMNYHPVVWSDARQISGDVIKVHFRDSISYGADSVAKKNAVLDRAVIPSGGFMAELIEEGYFNQLSGKEMVARFNDGQLRHLDVNGNVLAITFPEENDSTINKVLNIESSFLAADFADNNIKYMKLWSQTNATVTPLYLAKKSIFFLPAFKWEGDFRPVSPDDIFNFPAELQALFDAARGKAVDTAPIDRVDALLTAEDEAEAPPRAAAEEGEAPTRTAAEGEKAPSDAIGDEATDTSE